MDEIKALIDRIEKRYNTPPTKYNKFLPLVRRKEYDLLIKALRVASEKENTDG